MCYNGLYKMWQKCELELIIKIDLSSNYSLKFENMKMESLVIVDQNATVNTYSSFVHTARHAMELSFIGRYFDNFICCFFVLLEY